MIALKEFLAKVPNFSQAEKKKKGWGGRREEEEKKEVKNKENPL